MMNARTLLCVCLIVLASAALSAEKWVFLKDGRLCLSSLEGEQCIGRLAEGGAIEFSKDQVQGTRTPEQVEQAVDAMITEMVLGQNMEAHAGRFKVFRASAVPALLKHLAAKPLNERLSALYGLCFAWSPAALNPVMKAFRGSDAQVSTAAFNTLERNVQAAQLGALMKDLADDPDISKAALVFRAVEAAAPDPSLKRVKRLMVAAEGRSAVAPYLSHYFSLELVPGMLELLASAKVDEQRNAALGLIAASAADEKTRNAMSALLRNSDADLRQLAAEYFARTGGTDAVPLLENAVTAEQILYVKAAFEAALKVTKSRAAEHAAMQNTLSARWSSLNDKDTPIAKLRLCVDVLKNAPGTKDISKAQEVLRAAVQCEPQHWYSGKKPEWNELICARNSVERLLKRAPCGDLDAHDNNAAPPSEAAHFIPPIDGYFDAKRKSFGFQIPAAGGLFADSVHIGDDCGWHRDLCAIVATGSGIVRQMSYVPSWGHILVIEHTLPKGAKVCSLYGHVSPFIYVKEGERVEAGQKIASIGRANTIENGGYGAHLHFGIHEGAYNAGDWVCGYLSAVQFKYGHHGWLNPQAFLQEHK
ncbi:MAG TPA: peptidoglycan DD-metalloendopeptidase family protein [Planctomycetota bacterium]|nr:peptidoglycan DD-metalloendopeptidase family protein [Planctomycetota bacterium]